MNTNNNNINITPNAVTENAVSPEANTENDVIFDNNGDKETSKDTNNEIASTNNESQTVMSSNDSAVTDIQNGRSSDFSVSDGITYLGEVINRLSLEQNDFFGSEADTNKRRALFISEKLDKWQREAEALRGKYPEFSLAESCRSPEFSALLKGGLDVETAYTATNLEKIISNRIEKAISSVMNDLKVKGARVFENGISAGGGIIPGRNALTRKERAEIARRVEKGEKIIL